MTGISSETQAPGPAVHTLFTNPRAGTTVVSDLLTAAPHSNPRKRPMDSKDQQIYAAQDAPRKGGHLLNGPKDLAQKPFMG